MELTIILMLVILLIISNAYWIKKIKTNQFDNKEDYNSANIKALEETVERYRIMLHETKNQFLAVSKMMEDEGCKTNKYINTIIQNDFENDEAIQFEIRNIPINSLKALVYNKIKKAEEKNVNVDIFVQKEIKKFDLSFLTEEDEYDLSRIIGVFFDNAIEESVLKKFKAMSFSIIVHNDHISIEISNEINSKIDLKKIFEKGYTTKSTGHGYGLVLVKNILNKNKKLYHDVCSFDDCFIQSIKIYNK